jgi:hypothetical protein
MEGLTGDGGAGADGLVEMVAVNAMGMALEVLLLPFVMLFELLLVLAEAASVLCCK